MQKLRHNNNHTSFKQYYINIFLNIYFSMSLSRLEIQGRESEMVIASFSCIVPHNGALATLSKVMA